MRQGEEEDVENARRVVYLSWRSCTKENTKSPRCEGKFTYVYSPVHFSQVTTVCDPFKTALA